MRNDFAVLILTNGRASHVNTVSMLGRIGYTGKYYLVIDDEDNQRELYEQNYGKNHIVIFSKMEMDNKIDTMDNFGKRKVVYARNKVWDIAKDLSLKYFLVMDDDHNGLYFRYGKDGSMKSKKITNADSVFEIMITFLESSGADTVALAQGGDFLGGINGSQYDKGLLRKAMNSFFYRIDKPIEYKGTMNEDVIAYTTEGSRGRLFFTYMDLCITLEETQSISGGMAEEYKENGTYVKTAYALMSMPSAVKIGTMGERHRRIHHVVNWDCCVPKIINERWKKN